MGNDRNECGYSEKNCLRALEKSAADKVNIIAHSKGGLEARYMISRLGMASRVASLTTISTPHHGSKSIDLFYDFPKPLYDLAAFFVNTGSRLIGDRKPDFYRASRQMSSRECARFNECCPDAEGVFYQSYSAVMKYPFSDPMFFFMNMIVGFIEGKNDGLVTVDSARWGEYRGVIESPNWRGISHSDCVDLWRMNLFSFDIRTLYIDIVSGLAGRGL